MRVLVCFENRIRADATGVYFLNGFQSLGHDVTHVLPTEIDKVKPGDYDLYVKIDDGLNGSRWNKSLYPSAYYVIDTHLETDWRLGIEAEGEFDVVHCAQKNATKLPWRTSSVYWTPLGADPDVHNVGPKDKKYDVCFIGWFHSAYSEQRVSAVDALFRAFPNFYFGNRTFKEMTQKYAETKVVFNRSLNQDINMRFFEALCSGSALLTDRIDEIAELGFVEGEHYMAYANDDEMIAKAALLIDDETGREAIASRGQLLVLKKHTYAHRCEDIIRSLIGQRDPAGV